MVKPINIQLTNESLTQMLELHHRFEGQYPNVKSGPVRYGEYAELIKWSWVQSQLEHRKVEGVPKEADSLVRFIDIVFLGKTPKAERTESNRSANDELHADAVSADLLIEWLERYGDQKQNAPDLQNGLTIELWDQEFSVPDIDRAFQENNVVGWERYVPQKSALPRCLEDFYIASGHLEIENFKLVLGPRFTEPS